MSKVSGCGSSLPINIFHFSSHSTSLGYFCFSSPWSQSSPSFRKASSKVLSLIKSGLVRIRGCVLKKATIEQVWGRLNATLDSLLNDHLRNGQVTPQAQQSKGLGPCLKVLFHHFILYHLKIYIHKYSKLAACLFARIHSLSISGELNLPRTSILILLQISRSCSSCVMRSVAMHHQWELWTPWESTS